MLELLLTIILFPILELVVSIITDKFADKVKWKPFEKHYKESLSKNSKSFSMIREPNGKIVLWLGVGTFAFFWVLGAILTLVLTHSQQANTIDGIIMIISYTIICFPFISICLHYATKKIFVTEEQIFIKSIFIKKKYYIKDVTNINEKSKQISNLVTNHTLEIFFQNKKIKISNIYSNYDLLKNLLIDYKK